MSDDERVFLTPEQAIALLPDGEYVHTFRNPAGILLGADHDRATLEVAIRDAKTRELAGPMATSMKHGLLIMDDVGYLFIATAHSD